MKNLVLAFCSIRPKNISPELLSFREKEYGICLKQLKRVLPESFDMIICDNTIDDLTVPPDVELQEALKDCNILAMGSKTNIGGVNKGLGELLMLKIAMDNIDYEQYENICYVTARRIYTCPYAFEKTEQLKKEALLCNPDFLYVDGRYQESHKEGMYNDMFFAMKSKAMKEYAEYSYARLSKMSTEHIGSEQNLYSFVQTNNIEFEWIDFLGLVRNDWETDGTEFTLTNFHIT